jgi:anti-sigma regulatory factor (Ser/Thr protein kinase)
MRVQRHLAGVPESVAEARRFAIDALGDLPGDIVNDVAVMVSELATNALVHAATSFTVSVDRRERRVHVEVTDAGSGIPTRRSPGETEPHGRGLTIVEELSDQWGTTHPAGDVGKAVWFTINIPLGHRTSDAHIAQPDLRPDASMTTAAMADDLGAGFRPLGGSQAQGSMPPPRDRAPRDGSGRGWPSISEDRKHRRRSINHIDLVIGATLTWV